MTLSNEAKLGFVVTISIIIIILMIGFVGKLKFKEEGYKLRVRFDFVGELKVGAPVVFAGGLRVGKVENIVVYKDIVEVALKINSDFRIKEGNEIVIYTEGLLGDKYIEINGYDGPGEYLKDGDIVAGVSPVSLDAMTIKMAKLMKGVFGPTLTDEEVKKSFSGLFNNAGDFAYNLDMLIKENRGNIFTTIQNLKSTASSLDQNFCPVLQQLSRLSQDIGQISKENQQTINKTINNLSETSKKLNITVGELEQTGIYLDNITSAIKNRQGTIGKLIYEDDVHLYLLSILKNMDKFSEKISKNPQSIIFGK